ncbi:MAG: gamma-glutamylcyclotransferase family protein [Tepidisphaeraceae bacterium]
MYYFAYGTELSFELLQQWARLAGVTVPRRGRLEPAVLRAHRLSFNHFDPQLDTGIANILPEAGKSVHGALLDLSKRDLDLFDAIYDAPRLGQRRPIVRADRRIVSVLPYRSATPVQAVTYQFDVDPAGFAPPSRAYVEKLIEGASLAGVSMIWLMQLNALSSFLPREDVVRPSIRREREALTA